MKAELEIRRANLVLEQGSPSVSPTEGQRGHRTYLDEVVLTATPPAGWVAIYLPLVVRQ